MARALANSFTSSLGLRNKRVFRAVVACEDSETAQHARNVCGYLLEQFEPAQFIGQMWPFEVLRIPECRARAARGAASADMVMLSSHGAGELPSEVKVWIELWLQDKGDLRALVALFDRPRVHSAQDWPIQEYLAGVAERGHIRFIAEPDNWAGKGPRQIPLPLDGVPGLATSAQLPLELAGVHTSGAAHWGINE
ncbi:MAG TPA: hypothetical protein VMU04_18060 [Candidatus Acidoferrum sp.]|nr:hypothetical protein [Candidatus Acidoferrum sp.]